MKNSSYVDVTILEPLHRHTDIFSRYDSLQPGSELIIRNDHDPRPFYYQLLNERGSEFSWEYLQSGPEFWEVKITKRHSEKQTVTLGQLAAKDFRKAQVFKKYGLDFCCGGKKTLAEACSEKNLSVTDIERELRSIEHMEGGVQLNYNDWQPGFLIDFIVTNHHQYVRRSLQPLKELSGKVARAHGDKHPELPEVASLFSGIADEMDSHMQKEEAEVFPYIKNMVQLRESSTKNVIRVSANDPVSRMELEHELVGNKMQAINDLTHGYRIPAGACASYTLLLKWLKEFETDLHLHVHLENNILFRKAIEIENQLL